MTSLIKLHEKLTALLNEASVDLGIVEKLAEGGDLKRAARYSEEATERRVRSLQSMVTNIGAEIDDAEGEHCHAW